MFACEAESNSNSNPNPNPIIRDLTVDTRRDSVRECRREQALRAVEFYRSLRIPAMLQEMLNQTFHLQPDDVFAHLANCLSELSKPPLIIRLEAVSALDIDGGPAVAVQVLCKVGNGEQWLGLVLRTWVGQVTGSRSLDNPTMLDFLHWVNHALSDQLEGLQPMKQSEVDDLLRDAIKGKRVEIEEGTLQTTTSSTFPSLPTTTPSSRHKQSSKKESKFPPVLIPQPQRDQPPGRPAIQAASLAVARAAAHLLGRPLFQHVAALRDGKAWQGTDVTTHLYQEVLTPASCLPCVAVTVMCCRPSKPGQLLLLKEVLMLTIPGMAVTKGLQMIWEVQKQMVGILNSMTKGGFQGAAVELAPPTVPVDRPEQAMDLLLQASKATGFVPGTDFHIGINCAAHEIYDILLGRYEVVVGAPRTADEMPGMYLDLLTQYPALSALIDPLHSQDTEAWMRLAEQAPSCLLLVKGAGNDIVPGKELPGDGVVLPLEDHDTLSSLLEVSQALQDDKKSLVLAGIATDSLDYSLVDLAVGLQARWLKLGLVSWADHTAKGNRLAQVQRELLRCGTQDPLLIDTYHLAAN